MTAKESKKCENPSVLLIGNKRSGKGLESLDGVAETLETGGHKVKRVDPESIEDLQRRIAAAQEEIVVLAGGDGTLNAAAPAMVDRRLPLGIIPMGTANDLARGLGIPVDPLEAARTVLQGQLRAIDLGHVNGRPFFNVASLGLSVDVARKHRGELKRRLGVLNYPLSLWRAYRDHRPVDVEITIDSEVVRCRCSQVAVGNGRHYGGGLTLSERAEIDDGWLRVYYLRATGVFGLLRLAPAMRFGRLQHARDAAIRRAKRVELRTERPRKINVDGELLAETPAIIGILPGALSVFVPQASDTGGNGAQRIDKMNLLRDDRLVALNDLIEACREAARTYEAAAETLQDNPLSQSLYALSKERDRKADFLAQRVREDGDIPAGPPEEIATLATAATKAKALLSDDRVTVIRADCARQEKAVLDQAVSAQNCYLKDDEYALAAQLAAEAQENLESLLRSQDS